MLVAYEYARNELFGMQFEQFGMTTDGTTYAWPDAPLLRCLLQALVRFGLDVFAQQLFARFVKVG